MIQIEGLFKSFGEKAVLQNFSCSLPAGKTTCLMGPSGCGKTTLFRILLGLETPDHGVILGLEGKRKSAVFQEDRLCETLGPVPNLQLCSPGLSRERALSLLKDLGLEDSALSPISTFSGGMKRRVALLRALSAPYDILFLDEPFQGLDKETKQLTMDYVKKHTQGKTVFFITHDPGEADELSQHLILLPSTFPAIDQ